MKRILRFCVFLGLLFLFAGRLSADVIFIHGAKSKYSLWPKEGSVFYEEISAQASRLGIGKVISFGWSGKSGPPHSTFKSVQEHLRVAEKIALQIAARYKRVLLEKSDERAICSPLYIVAHSNGGLISSLVSQMLYDGLAGDFFLVNPDEADVKAEKTSGIITTIVASFQSAITGVCIWMKELFGRRNMVIECKKACKEKVFKKFDTTTMKCRHAITAAIMRVRGELKARKYPQIKIAQLIMMGTPFDSRLYAVNMNVVDKICFLFSTHDGIQRFFGQKRYPQGAGVINFRIAVKNPAGGIFYPMHSEMMYINGPSIARYVLELFSDAEKLLGGTDNDFSVVKAIDVLFDKAGNERPVLKIVESLKVYAFPVSGF